MHNRTLKAQGNNARHHRSQLQSNKYIAQELRQAAKQTRDSHRSRDTLHTGINTTIALEGYTEATLVRLVQLVADHCQFTITQSSSRDNTLKTLFDSGQKGCQSTDYRPSYDRWYDGQIKAYLTAGSDLTTKAQACLESTLASECAYQFGRDNTTAGIIAVLSVVSMLLCFMCCYHAARQRERAGSPRSYQRMDDNQANAGQLQIVVEPSQPVSAAPR